jgi:hypothetical protein
MKNKGENIENQFGNLRNEELYRVPENYFETFEDRLMVRIRLEGQPVKKRSLYYYLKPALSMAASIALIMLLVYVPVKKFFPSDKGYVAQKNLISDPVDSSSLIPATLISYFTEGQFLSAVSDMKDFEADTLSTDNLAEFIAANYSEYDIIAYN